jgi:response regulator of citrate/malate metabolism
MVFLDIVKFLEEALECLKKERFDLIFLDYLLPDGTGMDFLEAVNNSSQASTLK